MNIIKDILPKSSLGSKISGTRDRYLCITQLIKHGILLGTKSEFNLTSVHY